MTENMFTVSTTIQTADRSNPPTRMQWYRGTSHVNALAALVQAGADTSDERYDSDGDPIPDSVRYIMLDVSMTVEPVEEAECICYRNHPSCACPEHPTCQGQHSATGSTAKMGRCNTHIGRHTRREGCVAFRGVFL